MNLRVFSERFFGVSPSRLVLGLAILAAIVGTLFWLDSRGGGESDLGALDSRSAQLDEPAPDFALKDTSGNVVSLSDYAGQPVWLNFWASWCIPCRDELPDIQALADEFGDKLVVLTINQGQSRSTATGFWDEIGIDLPILLDSNQDLANQYRLVGLPNNFFIDSDGVLRAFNYGFLTQSQMREDLTKIGVS